MVHKIFSITTQNVYNGAAFNVPVCSRLLKAQGENTTSPTYDFTVDVEMYNGSATVTTSTRYVGIRNGQTVDLLKDFPMFANITTTATTLRDFHMIVTAGLNVNLVVFLNQNSLNTN